MSSYDFRSDKTYNKKCVTNTDGVVEDSLSTKHLSGCVNIAHNANSNAPGLPSVDMCLQYVDIHPFYISLVVGDEKLPIQKNKSESNIFFERLQRLLYNYPKSGFGLRWLKKINLKVLKQDIMQCSSKTNYIYVISSPVDAYNNRFIVSGCKSFDEIQRYVNRLNTFKLNNDWFYISFYIKVNDYKTMLKKINTILIGFKEYETKNVYILHHNKLVSFIKNIVSNFNDEKSGFENIKIENSKRPAFIPQPIVLSTNV